MYRNSVASTVHIDVDHALVAMQKTEQLVSVSDMHWIKMQRKNTDFFKYPKKCNTIWPNKMYWPLVYLS